jgi:hypothetical protein
VCRIVLWPEALEAVTPIPSHPVKLRVESAGRFPAGGLVLACVLNHALLEEQQRVHEAIELLAVGPWPYFDRDGWVPHIALGSMYTAEQLAEKPTRGPTSAIVEAH